MSLVEEEAPKADEEVVSWGSPDAAPPPAEKMFWFTLPDGSKFSHFDVTGREAAVIEKRLGVSWWSLQPLVFVEHALAVLEVFLARTDPQHAAERVAAMTVKEIDVAVVYEAGRSDDLPDQFVDGLPKVAVAR